MRNHRLIPSSAVLVVGLQALSLLSVSLIAPSLLPAPAQAQTTQTDFDGDGRSDLTLIAINSDGTLSWKSAPTLSGTSQNRGALGKNGDHITLAHWRGTSAPQLGVISSSADGSTIVWKILDETGQLREMTLGAPADTALAGADYNGNGLADAATAKLAGNRVRWTVQFDAFGATPTSMTRLFGVKGDRVFYLNPDGTNDWFASIGKASNGKRSELKMMNPLTGEVRKSARFPKYISQGDRPRPVPVRGPDGRDVLLISKTSDGNTVCDFRDLSGKLIVKTTFEGEGIIVVGDFSADAGEEIAIKTSSGFTIYNPFNTVTQNVASESGIAIDEININTLSVTAAPPSNPGGGDDDNGSTPPVAGVCSKVVAWPGSHIYKTVGSNHFTDIRRNTIGVIIKPGGVGPFPGCLIMKDSRGNEIARLGLYARGAGWAARYYAGIGCGAGTPFNGNAVAQRARSKSGSSSVVVDFGGVCYGPIEATKCLNSSSC